MHGYAQPPATPTVLDCIPDPPTTANRCGLHNLGCGLDTLLQDDLIEVKLAGRLLAAMCEGLGEPVQPSDKKLYVASPESVNGSNSGMFGTGTHLSGPPP